MIFAIRTYKHTGSTKVIGFIGMLCFMFLGLTSVHGQQAFSYTQYMNDLTPINPASTLFDGDGGFNLLARKQWAGIVGAPTTLFFDGNLPIKATNGTAGFVFENNKFGPENLTELNGFYAQSVRLGWEQYLALSLNVGLRSYTANNTQLDPTDKALGPDINQSKPNLGFSVLYYSKTAYVGLSVPELTIRNLGKASVTNNNYFRNNYFLTAGITQELSEGIKIKPALLVSYTRGLPLITDISAMASFNDVFGVGLNYRTNNEAALIVSTDFLLFHVGYSYQFGVSGTTIGGFTNTTQEITIGYRLSHKRFNIDRVKRVF